MKKLSLGLLIATLFFGITPAFSADDWMPQLQKAVSTGNFSEIDVIAATNPTDQGAIAMYLLSQAENNLNTHPELSIKLFSAAAPFAGQIPLGDARTAGTVIATMLGLASNPDFQKRDPKDAASVFRAALAMSSEPNIIVANPGLHNLALADAGDFAGGNGSDPSLQDEVNLALQVGSPPPLGPHGVINPSPE